jgi:hypothetical protein
MELEIEEGALALSINTLLSNFLLHVLYIRSIIPLPFVSLKALHESLILQQQQAADASTNPTMKPPHRNAAAFRKQSEFLGEIGTILVSIESCCSLMTEHLATTSGEQRPG